MLDMTKTIVKWMAVLGLCSLASVWADDDGGVPAKTTAPAWKLSDLNGKPVSSDDFKGKVVVLDFWATWCPPCRAEIPSLIALQQKYGAQGLQVIGISVDEGGADVVKPFVKKMGINYPVVLADEKVQRDFGGLDAIPVGLIIDREGRIVQRHLGLTSQDDFEAEIKPLLH